MEELDGLLSGFAKIGAYVTYFAIAVVLYFIWSTVRGKPVRVVNRNAIPVKFGHETPKNVNHNGKPEDQKKVVQYLNYFLIDSTFWLLLLFTYGIGVVIRHMNNLMTNDDFDKLLDSKSKEVASQIADRALKSHGMDADEVKEIPPILAEDFNPKSRFSKLCSDLKFRASEYQMTYLMFSEKQMYSFRHTFDLTSADTDEQTNEFFYEDITSVDITKTQRDMPVPRSWMYFFLCISGIFIIPQISMLPFVPIAMSIFLLKLFIFLFICAITFGFWMLFNRMIENGIWKKLNMVGLIIIIASLFLHLFAKSGNDLDEMQIAKSSVMMAKEKITTEMAKDTLERNQITSQMEYVIERERSLSVDVEGVGDYRDLPQYLVERIEYTKRQINDLKIQIANYRTQIAVLTTKINNYNMQINDYDLQIEDFNTRFERNDMFVSVLRLFNVLGYMIVAISCLIILFTVGFYRRVVEKLILRLTVAGDEFECAMNPDNIEAIQGMKAKIREKKKV